MGANGVDAVVAIFGVSDLMGVISDMRREGFLIHKRKITFGQASRQTKQFVVYEPPKNLLEDEIYLTQYWYET